MRVDAFVREREGKLGVGMIEQSLCHHLKSRLTEYYRLVAVLESQMSANSVRPDGLPESATEAGSMREGESGLTLKRLDVWIEDWRLRMRMMSVCVEGARGKLGVYHTTNCHSSIIFSCTGRGSGQSHTRLCRQWRSLCQEVH